MILRPQATFALNWHQNAAARANEGALLDFNHSQLLAILYSNGKQEVEKAV